MPERILLLSRSVPPETTGSAVVVLNLAKQFSRAEMVVAGEHPHGRPAIVWKEEWPEIVYLIKGWSQTSRGTRWRRRTKFPWLIFRCLRLVRKYKCKAIVAVFPNEDFLLAGYVVSVLTRAKFYPYFHNTYLEQCQLGSLHYRFARWFQSRVFTRAKHIFVMSEGMVQLYRERYPDLKCSALVHSFNEDIPEFNRPPQPGTSMRFAMCGNINESCAEATVRVCAAIRQLDSPLTILSGTARTYLRRLGILQGKVRYETVSWGLMVQRLEEADIVVLAHGFKGGLSKEEYSTIFPTRTIEYLICGRPILAHAPADCHLTRFLREQGCALVVDEPSVEAILAAIQRLYEDGDLRSFLVRNALRTAELFRAPVVAAALRLALAKS